MTTALDLLQEAKTVLAESGWMQGDYAQDKFGNSVPFNAVEACHFCALGALYRVASEHEVYLPYGPLSIAEDALDLGFRQALGLNAPRRAASANDAPLTTREDVLKAYDYAIEFTG